jgi:predicted transcriptional regulator of viral defense system
MKTAVEWYNSKVIELMKQREQGNIDEIEYGLYKLELLNKAKQMFEEQIINAWNSAAGGDGFSSAGQYYISNFKSE